MFLIDTSVWINIFRDQTGLKRQQLEAVMEDQPFFLSRFTQMELLQGCQNEREWTILETYLEDQEYLEITNRHLRNTNRV